MLVRIAGGAAFVAAIAMATSREFQFAWFDLAFGVAIYFVAFLEDFKQKPPTASPGEGE